MTLTPDEATAIINHMLDEDARDRRERILFAHPEGDPDLQVLISQTNEESGRTVWLRQESDIIGIPLDQWGRFTDACEAWYTTGHVPLDDAEPTP